MSQVTPLVMARGHRIGRVPEIPLVLSDDVQAIKKTKDAMAVLASASALADVQRVARTKKVRAGKGKARNRRYVQRRGPLVVFANDDGLTKAFRNIPGVDVANVYSLNFLQLAPGGHIGRFIIWTESAFKALEELYGSGKNASSLKKGYRFVSNSITWMSLCVPVC